MLEWIIKDILWLFRHFTEIFTSKRNIRFGKLHEMRAEVIPELSSKLNDAVFATKDYLSLFSFGGNTKKELLSTAKQKMKEFLDYYEKHKIKFNEGLCDKMDNLLKELSTLILKGEYALGKVEYGANKDEILSDLHKLFIEFQNHNIPELKVAIEDDLRKLLGV